MDDEGDGADYAHLLGRRMREVRREVGLTLLDVAEKSNGHFKASVVGAYERGERAITVQRLEQLAACYGVPTWRLMPRSLPAAAPSVISGRALVLDVAALRARRDRRYDALARFVGYVLDARGVTHDERWLAVRAEDRTVVAALIGVEADELVDRLAELEVLRAATES